MTPTQAAEELNRMAEALPEAMRGVVRQSAVELHSFAQGQSSGPLRPADLARMDHPFATRHGGPRLNPNVVNRQSGAFFAGWDLEGPTISGDGYKASVFNTDPKAELLEEGTRLMFERDPEEAAADREEPLFEERAERELARVMGG